MNNKVAPDVELAGVSAAPALTTVQPAPAPGVANSYEESNGLETSASGPSAAMSIEDQLLLACETGDLQLLERILKKVDKDAVLSMRDSQTWPLLAIAGRDRRGAVEC